MTDEPRTTRRGALATLIGIVVGALTTAGTAAASTEAGRQRRPRPGARDRADERTAGKPSRHPAGDGARIRSGIYTGTVDRIVDGEHVVVLLESGGRTVDQVVVGHDRTPDAEEGDRAVVWLQGGSVLGIWTR